MLQLTSRGNYGILAVYYIAQRAVGEYISIDEIIENSQIPKPYLSKILQDLCRNGILVSRRGSGGGFSLARHPRDVNLKDVIEAIEGKIYLVNCLQKVSPSCWLGDDCPIVPIWVSLQGFVAEIIESISFEDIIDKNKKRDILDVLTRCQEIYREKFTALKATDT